MRIRCKVEGSDICYYLQIGTMNIQTRDYYCDAICHAIPHSRDENGFQEYELRFTDFKQPIGESPLVSFDLRQAFEIAIIARPKVKDYNTHRGKVWIDSISLFK